MLISPTPKHYKTRDIFEQHSSTFGPCTFHLIHEKKKIGRLTGIILYLSITHCLKNISKNGIHQESKNKLMCIKLINNNLFIICDVWNYNISHNSIIN